jgi:glycosyltransferase
VIISIITAVYNRENTIGDALHSLREQTYPDVESIIIDSASTDNTLEVARHYADDHTVLVTEPDNGIYDALNKGLAHATGDVIGIMHSDDLYPHGHVLEQVAVAFEDPSVDAVYGDLQYVMKDNPSRVIRHWVAGEFSLDLLTRGWMPPHPTLFLRRSVIERWGGYNTNYQIAADYDAILRYFVKGKIHSVYIPEVLVKMRIGGESNRSLGRVIRKSYEDYCALQTNGVGGIRSLFWKNVSKIKQFYDKES